MNTRDSKLILAAFLASTSLSCNSNVSETQPVVADEPPENRTHVEYWPNGQKSRESHLKNGKPDGLWTHWHENGQKFAEGHTKNGKADGPVTGWHANGQKDSEYHFKDGKPDGLWTEWDENGRKKSETHFKNGIEVSRKDF